MGFMNAIVQGLLKFIRARVDEIIGEIRRTIERIRGEVYEVLQGFIREIIDEIWIGPGATQFVDDFNREIVPLIESILGSLENTCTGINEAGNTIETAERAAQNKVADLNDLYSKINN